MAKTKVKKEEVIDLSRPEKVTEDQLKRVKDVVGRINNSQMELGMMECRKHQILHYIAGTNDELSVIQTELEKEYGTFDINVEDGTIKYVEENGEVNS
tara:strand:+ start:222 stop:515 length:294 start_codon:yes stop_codon:yes gene_type:complete